MPSGIGLYCKNTSDKFCVFFVLGIVGSVPIIKATLSLFII